MDENLDAELPSPNQSLINSLRAATLSGVSSGIGLSVLFADAIISLLTVGFHNSDILAIGSYIQEKKISEGNIATRKMNYFGNGTVIWYPSARCKVT